MTDYQTKIFNLQVKYSLVGLVIEQVHEPENLDDKCLIYVSTPKKSTMGPAGEELAKMYKEEYIKAILDEFDDLSREDFLDGVVIYNRVRDAEWTREDFLNVKRQLKMAFGGNEYKEV